MDSSLDDITDSLGKLSPTEQQHWALMFFNGMKNAEFLFGSKYSFRKVLPRDLEPSASRQLINKALFVCWSVLLSKCNPVTLAANNTQGCLTVPLADRISNDSRLFNYLSYGTNSKANLQYAFAEAEKLINTHLIL